MIISVVRVQIIATLFAIGFALAQTDPLSAQSKSAPEKVVIGEWCEIDSKVLDEKRRFIVSTPPGYRSKDKIFHTIYLLDGPSQFQPTVGLVNFLVNNDLMPPAIVVAVANTERGRDMTPRADTPTKYGIENLGGADDFVAFFRDELIPHIEKNYPVHSRRTLIGHSLGGLFALHTLVHHNETFDAYIAISPALHYDEQRLVQQAESYLKSSQELHKSLYLTMANEGGAMLGGLQKLAGVLAEHKPMGFDWDYRIMKEETHTSVFYRSSLQGLEFVFANWALKDPLSLYESGGIKEIESFYEKSSKRYGIQRSLSPDDIFQIAESLVAARRFEECRKVLEYDTNKYPMSAKDISYFAARLEEAKDIPGAIELYQRILKSDSSNQKARKALMRLGVHASDLPKVDESSGDDE